MLRYLGSDSQNVNNHEMRFESLRTGETIEVIYSVCTDGICPQSALPSSTSQKVSIPQTSPSSCSGCYENGNCYQIGYRMGTEYCSEDNFIEQSAEESYCNNDFECSSNICADSTCVSKGVFSTFLDWFRGLFG